MAGSMLGALVGIVIAGVFSGILIWVVSKLNLGLSVDGFLSAFIAGVAIAILGGVINWGLAAIGLQLDPGIVSAIVHLIVAALVIYLAGSLLKGLTVNGFGGALVAAIAIAVLVWLIGIALSVLGFGTPTV